MSDTIATFRKRADNWEANEGEIGKIVASEIRGVVDEFERELTQWREVAGRLANIVRAHDIEKWGKSAGTFQCSTLDAFDALAKLSDGGKG